MSIEKPNFQEKPEGISLKDYEDSMERIKNNLLVSVDSKEIKDLNDEFIRLWKQEPQGVSEKTSNNIDSIRDILMDKA